MNQEMADAIKRLQERHGDEHDEYPRSEWRIAVAGECTLLGYWEWVQHQIEADLRATFGG